MAGKLPYMQFYPGDWLKDPNIAMCSPVTRGIWFDFLCAMHESDRSGQITGTREQLARVGRCTTVELDHALSELKSTCAADVTIRNEIVTVVNRRMHREFKTRENTRGRVVKYRKKHPQDSDCNVPVTKDIHIHIQNTEKNVTGELHEKGIESASPKPSATPSPKFLSQFESEFPLVDHVKEFRKCQNYYNARNTQITDWSSLYSSWLQKDFPKAMKPVPKKPPVEFPPESEQATPEKIHMEIAKARKMLIQKSAKVN